MTIFARSLHSLSEARSAAARARILATALVVSLAATAMLVAPAAHALVVPAGAGKVGLQPRNGATLGAAGSETETFANEAGNVVLHGTGDYAIYWDPSKQLHHEWVVNLDTFFAALGGADLATPFAEIGQYHDRSNAKTPFQALFKGAYSDTSKFPPKKCTDPKDPTLTCVTDTQLREQLQSFVTTHGLPTGMGTVYYLLTPPGTTLCLEDAAARCSDYVLSGEEIAKGERKSASYRESFCSYHGDINPDGALEGDGSTILYAAIPWIASTTAYDCQDGGFNPEKNEEHRETERELTEAEETALEKATHEQQEAAEARHRLEGPHIEEPNQAGKGEEGDYSSALSDILVNQIAEEEMNIVTDPLLSSWQNASGSEVTDLCRNSFAATAGASGGAITGTVTANQFTEAGTLANVSVGGHSYYINNVLNLGRLDLPGEPDPCAGGVGLLARFTPPNPVNTGEIIGVDGMESTVALLRGKAFGPSGPPTTTYATFGWSFGDGTPEVKGFAPGAPLCEEPWLSPCAASAFHSYQYGGTYTVTLTITDVAGNVTSVSHEVTVDGPAAPSSAATARSTSAGSGTQGSGSSPVKGATAAVPGPVVAAAIGRQTLHSAAHKGLAVRYSVNEQVAGHFEVLLGSGAAHRLGITGAPAVGLPVGSPPELVIAKAFLVTTKGGRSAIHIAFPKRTSARLARAHKVSLMLRLTVRNAAGSDPLSTTVLSSVTLSG